LPGYIKAENKESLAARLDRIEGQARGIKRMVEREDYCIDILTQITSLIAASEKVATLLIQDHVDYCVPAFEPRMARAPLQACAEACRLCGEECESHAEHGMEHCRVCAEACRRCEEVCNNVLSAVAA